MKNYKRFADLKAKGLVNNRATLKNWIDAGQFPPGKMIGPNTRVWTDEEIDDWYASCPTAPKPVPRSPGRPRGRRPRKASAEPQVEA